MKELTLTETLAAISRSHIILLSNGKPWAGAAPISRTLQHACRSHRAELVQMITQSHWRVCASPDNHWRYWNVETDQCEACAHLQIALQTLDRRRRRRKIDQVERLVS